MNLVEELKQERMAERVITSKKEKKEWRKNLDLSFIKGDFEVI